MAQKAVRSEASSPNSLGPERDCRTRTILSWLLAALGGGHKCTATALSIWGMPAYPLATPPSRVVRTEEADERLLAVKGAIHELVSSSCTSGKKGTGAGRGCEPRPAPRNQSSSRKGSGLGGLLTSSPMLRLSGQAWPSALGPVRRWRQHPRGAAPPHLYPHRTWTRPPMLRSTSYLQLAHRMKCWMKWFALLEFALSVEVPRGIADERDSADRTVTPTGNKTKMNGFVEISTLLIHLAPKQKSNEWMHLSPFYTRMHGEWLRYAKSTSQFHWRFLFSQRCSGLPGKSPMSSRHNVSVPSIREQGLRT